MRKIIRSSDLLPPLFSIDRYKDMDRLSANTWFHLLEARFLIHYEILEGRGFEFWLGKDVLNTDEEQEATTLLLEYFLKIL